MYVRVRKPPEVLNASGQLEAPMGTVGSVLCVLAMAVSVAYADGPSSGVSVYDLTGREMGRLDIEGVTGPCIRPLRNQPMTRLDGTASCLPSGVYLVSPSGSFRPPTSPRSAGSFLFIDVSAIPTNLTKNEHPVRFCVAGASSQHAESPNCPVFCRFVLGGA